MAVPCLGFKRGSAAKVRVRGKSMTYRLNKFLRGAKARVQLENQLAGKL